MEVSYVKTAYDLFKTIMGDNPDHEIDEVLDNTRYLVNRVPVNIFQDEYAIIYQSAKWCVKNNMPLTRDVLQQLMLNSRDELLESKKIVLGQDANNDEERFVEMVNLTLSEYDSMASEEFESRHLQGETNLYLQTWAQEEMQRLIYDLNIIYTEGLRVGTKTYQGAEGVNNYYKRKYELIDSIVNERKDYLADDINNAQISGLEIKDKISVEETDTEYISKFGITSIDNQIIGAKTGEMIVVQGGSGVGKTRYAVGTLGYNALKMGKNVLHISLEQKPQRIYPMYQARHLLEQLGTRVGLTSGDLIKNTYDASLEGVVQESYIDLADNPEMGNLYVVGRKLDAVDIEDYLNSIYDEFQFDVVILDHFTLLGTKSSASKYVEMSDAANTLTTACKYFRGRGFLAVVLNQISSDVEGKFLKGDTREAKIAGSSSQDLLRGSDITLTLYEDENMKEDASMKLLLNKLRDSGYIPDVLMDVDKGRCYFAEKEPEDEFSLT